MCRSINPQEQGTDHKGRDCARGGARTDSQHGGQNNLTNTEPRKARGGGGKGSEGTDRAGRTTKNKQDRRRQKQIKNNADLLT